MPLPLETARLFFYATSATLDLDALLGYRSDPLVARYQGWEAPYEVDAGRTFIEEMKNAIPGTPGMWFQAVIELKSSKEILGDCAFHIMASDHRQAYIGITLARPYWGNGYGEEACRGLLNYLFGELTLHRVVAECDVENKASYKLLERLGFRREAQLIENIWFKGAWGSEYHYALLDHEWKVE